MLVRDQVLSLLNELKERSHEQEPTGRVNRTKSFVLIEFFIAMAHGLLQALDLFSIGVVALY